MIRLHRLAHPEETYFLNPDLIVSVESTPDTVVTLTTHSKVLVAESAEQVVEAVMNWRAAVVSAAVRRSPRRAGSALALVRGGAGEHVDPSGGAR